MGGLRVLTSEATVFSSCQFVTEMKILNEILRFDFFVVDGAKLLGLHIISTFSLGWAEGR